MEAAAVVDDETNPFEVAEEVKQEALKERLSLTAEEVLEINRSYKRVRVMEKMDQILKGINDTIGIQK